MCENHNTNLRNYLREQPDNLKSFNLVKEVVNYLSDVYTNVDDESIETITQIVESLNEFAMGNVENQMVMFDSKAMDVTNHLMRQAPTSFKRCSGAEVANLKLKCMILIKTMLEDNGSVAQALAKQILSILDLGAVYENMVSFCPSSPSLISKGQKLTLFLFYKIFFLVKI